LLENVAFSSRNLHPEPTTSLIRNDLVGSFAFFDPPQIFLLAQNPGWRSAKLCGFSQTAQVPLCASPPRAVVELHSMKTKITTLCPPG